VKPLSPYLALCSGLSVANLPTAYRAEDGIRTRDPNLGKVVRYRCATSANLAENQPIRVQVDPRLMEK
jgi:hypothetical protein